MDRKRLQPGDGVVPEIVIPEGVVIVGVALRSWCGRRRRRRRGTRNVAMNMTF